MNDSEFHMARCFDTLIVLFFSLVMCRGFPIIEIRTKAMNSIKYQYIVQKVEIGGIKNVLVAMSLLRCYCCQALSTYGVPL